MITKGFLPEDDAYYISKRVGCTLEEALDYVLTQRKFFLHKGITHAGSDADVMVMDDKPLGFKTRMTEMCPFISKQLKMDLKLCEKMALAEREYMAVHFGMYIPVLDRLDQRLDLLNDDQRKEVLPILQTLYI